MSVLRLFCYILGSKGYPFYIDILASKNVCDLRNAIVIHKKLTMAGDDLKLWKHYTRDTQGVKLQLESFQPRDEDILASSALLGTIFSDIPDGFIHVIVQIQSFSPPARIGFDIITRENTVSGLYDTALCHGLVQVRGTPASGKSITANLLYDHITRHNPNSQVSFIDWQEDTDWRMALPSRPRLFGDKDFLIVDEAQGSYTDRKFWEFLKTIHASSACCVILFCSYGSPTTDVHEIRTTMVISERQRISLQPVNHPGFAPVGLLLNQAEFDDLIQKWGLTSKLDQSFRQTIFEVTAGHVGAVVDFINFIKAQDIYHRLRNTAKCLTLEEFLKATSYHQFITTLTAGSSVFQRGLPNREDLQTRSIAMVFQAVLRNHSVTNQVVKENEREALQTCYRRGWLHSDLISHSRDVQYFFASPLHRMFVENFLYGSSNVHIRETTLLDFVIAVCRKMSPINLQARQVGAAHIQRTPEAQYGDEFYRACMDHTEGSVVTLSEFGTKDGRIDFYLPSKRWGVEILRNGNNIQEHNDRFVSGAYLKWIVGGEMEDYLLLDFRQNAPRAKRPNMTRLWHVIINGSLMWILDNMLERVCADVNLLPRSTVGR